MTELELDPNKEWGLMVYSDGGARPNPGAIGIGMHGYFYPVKDEQTRRIMTDKELDHAVRTKLKSSPEMSAAVSFEEYRSAMIDAGENYISLVKNKPIRFTDGETIKYAYASAKGYIYCSKDGVASNAVGKNIPSVDISYYLEVAESSSNQLTNNFAEMSGLYNALKLARHHRVTQLHVISDSDYALKALTQWCPGWEERGWTTKQGEPVKNLELVQAMYSEYKKAKAEGMRISGNWIKGHKGHPGNMEADSLATIGVFKSRHGIDDATVNYFTAKEYQDPKRDRHPLLSLKRMYFNREKDRNIAGTYYMADPGGEDHLIGKPMPETVFAVVRMNEPVDVVSSVWDAQFRYGQDFDRIMMMRMENLYAPEVFRLISTHGEYALSKDLRSTGLMALETRPITVEKNPVGITMRAIDSINSLERIFDKYLEVLEAGKHDFAANNSELMIHDITSLFFEDVEKKVGKEVLIKKAFTKDVQQGQKSIAVTFERDDLTKTIPLKFALDLPDRNSLKKLETSDPTVHLITWRESETVLRYASVISCEEGRAIWSNFYADRIYSDKEKVKSKS